MASRLSAFFSSLPPLPSLPPIKGLKPKAVIAGSHREAHTPVAETQPRDSARVAAPRRFVVARPTGERPAKALTLAPRPQAVPAPVHVGRMAPVSKTLHGHANKLQRRLDRSLLLDRLSPHWNALQRLGGVLSLYRAKQKAFFKDINSAPNLSVRICRTKEFLERLDEAEQTAQACIDKAPRGCIADRRWLAEVMSDIKSQQEHLRAVLKGLEDDVDLHQQQIDAYSRSAVPVNWRTRRVDYADESVVTGSSAQVGAGQVHQIERLTYRVTNPESGATEEVNKVFKGELEVNQAGPEALNFTLNQENGFGEAPFLSGRAVATSLVDKALGSNLIPNTEFAIHEGRFGVVMDWVEGVAPQSKGKAHLAVTDARVVQWAEKHPTELAQLAREWGFNQARWSSDASGIEFLHSYEDNVYDDQGVGLDGPDGQPLRRQVAGDIEHVDLRLQHDPVYRRELSDAQWLGFLTNQADWHRGNYAIQRDADGAVQGLRFFDNDASCGERDLADLQKHSVQNPTYLTGLPPVISGRMYQAIQDLEPQALRNQLQGLVSPSEIQAHCDRLGVLKAHAQTLSNQGLVLETPGDWTSAAATQALQLDKLDAIDRATSAAEVASIVGSVDRANYVARDLAQMKGALRLREIKQSIGEHPVAVFDAAAISRALAQRAAAAA